MEGVAIGHNCKREPSKDDSGQVWIKLAQWFQRRRFLKKFRRKTDDGRQVMAIAHTGELKRAITPRWVIKSAGYVDLDMLNMFAVQT